MLSTSRVSSHLSQAKLGARLGIVLALILLVVGVVAQGAFVPHLHIGVGAGLYNGEHDLTLYAVSGMVGPFAESPLLFIDRVTATLSRLLPPVATPIVSRDAESRAPPAA
jgi:hypothetical protein